MNIIFAGTPIFAAHHLQALIDSEHNVVAVYTQPDRPAGRGKKLTASPVKQLALEHQLAVEQPASLKSAEAQAVLASYEADVMVVVAYGLLLPQAVLDTPPYGCLNVHGSLLPRWRGAAPIQRAIAAGDTETGITIMQMDKGLDTGAMLLKSKCTIESDDSSASLHDKLMALGGPALLTTLADLDSYQKHAQSQDDTRASYAEKISKQEAQIDWSQAAQVISRNIRAFNPFPVAYTFLHGERVKISAATAMENSNHNASVGEIIAIDDTGMSINSGVGSVVISSLQMPGKKPMSIKELLNGYSDRFSIGQCFTYHSE